jgi:sodium/hydrogen antiporter
VLAVYLTVGLSVLAHGVSAAPLADRYARWFERQARRAPPPLESASTDVTRTRGPAPPQSAETTEVNP